MCRSDDSAIAKDLERRQNARKPCRCPRAARNNDLFVMLPNCLIFKYLLTIYNDRNEAVGLNRMFCHREDEEVHFEKDIVKELRKEFQKPDAIYGLRKTRNIENLLYDTRKRKLDEANDPRQLHELLEPSLSEKLINDNGEPLLYPFLILEAKSGQAQKDWHSINMQTAFPIRALLRTQARLRSAADPHESFEPLVWFFSYKGEDWRLSIAFQQKASAEENRIGTTIYVSHAVTVPQLIANPCSGLLTFGEAQF